jgi:UPF0716 protein FxsA
MATLLPLAELAVLYWIATRTSLLFAIGLVLVAGLVGVVIAKIEGWNAVRRIQDDLAARRVPADAALDALFILLAGALFFVPGVLTDLLGFALLVPPLRRWMKTRLKRRFAIRFPLGHARTANRSEIIDAKIVSEDRKEET